jgi:uncharacterized protein YifE (UPF0438 family)
MSTIERVQYGRGWGVCAACDTQRPTSALESKPFGDGANVTQTATVCIDKEWCKYARRVRKTRRAKQAKAEEGKR